MSRLAELKPCPFCGGEAKLVEDTGTFDTPFGLVTLHANTCFLSARAGPSLRDEQIAEAWNTRTADAEPLTTNSVGDSETADTAVNAEPGGDVVGTNALAGRLEYILDQKASAVERMHRRAHLTDHDLRRLLAAIRATQPIDAEVCEMVEKLQLIADEASAYDTLFDVLEVCRRAATLLERLAPAAVRREALEEAAKIAETYWVAADYNTVGIADADMAMELCRQAAAAIRQHKDRTV